jgi:hypothetical protein
MSATEGFDTGKPLPRLSEVRCIDGEHRLIRVSWTSGSRGARSDVVDLSPLIDSHKFYAPLRNDPKLFASVHLLNDGSAIAWGADDAIDMSAPSIQRLAEETMGTNRAAQNL